MSRLSGSKMLTMHEPMTRERMAAPDELVPLVAGGLSREALDTLASRAFAEYAAAAVAFQKVRDRETADALARSYGRFIAFFAPGGDHG